MTTLMRTHSCENVTFAKLVKTEFLKIQYCKIVYPIYACVFVGTLFLTWFSSLLLRGSGESLTTQSPEMQMEEIIQASSASFYFTTTVFAFLGAFFITREFTSKSILTTLSTVPNRFAYISAKTCSTVCISVIVGASSWIVSTLLIKKSYEGFGINPEITSRYFEFFSQSILYITVISVFGVSMGFLLRNTVSALAIFGGLFFVYPFTYLIIHNIPIIQQSVIPTLDKYNPVSIITFLSQLTDSGFQSVWQNVSILLAWAIIPFIIAVQQFIKRDV